MKVGIIIMVLFVSSLFAHSVPNGINYQGKLFENGGPIDGETRDFRFRLFTDVNGDGDFADSGDTLGWTSGDTTGVSINDGLFSVVLDGISSYLGYDSVYLAVFVKKSSETDYTVLGNERLWSAPYALSVPEGTGMPTGSDGQTLRHNGTSWVANSVLYNDGTNIGIGTPSPSEKLDVEGNIEMNSNEIKNVATPTTGISVVGDGVSTNFLNGEPNATSTSFKLYRNN